MALLSVMVIVVLIAGGVLGFLFFMLGKEGRKEETQAVPLASLKEFGQGSSSGLQAPEESKSMSFAAEMHGPVTETQEVVGPLEMRLADGPGPSEMAYKNQAEELEKELQQISQKADFQSQEARQMIDALTKENEQLKSQQAGLQEANEKLVQLQGQTVDLSSRNEALSLQLDSANSKVRLLEEEMAAVQKHMGDELAKADAAIEQMRAEKETLAMAPPPPVNDAANRELEDLKAQYEQLKKIFKELEGANAPLKEANAHLSQKVESLEYDLIKMRAQATGLDRLCRNYKMQLDDLTEKFKEAQTALGEALAGKVES